MPRRFDPPAMHAALEAERDRRQVSWSQIAIEVGVSTATLKRLAEHGRFELDGVLAIAQWLDRPLEDSTRPGGPPPEARPAYTLKRNSTEFRHIATCYCASPSAQHPN